MSTKLCTGCNLIKFLDLEFHKAGKYYQKLCKICYNQRRNANYAISTINRTKKTGFKKIPEACRKQIIKHIHDNKNYKLTAATYGIKYSTMLYWKKQNQIPPYIEVVVIS
jgi:hypothetical protein